MITIKSMLSPECDFLKGIECCSPLIAMCLILHKDEGIIIGVMNNSITARSPWAPGANVRVMSGGSGLSKDRGLSSS